MSDNNILKYLRYVVVSALLLFFVLFGVILFRQNKKKSQKKSVLDLSSKKKISVKDSTDKKITIKPIESEEHEHKSVDDWERFRYRVHVVKSSQPPLIIYDSHTEEYVPWFTALRLYLAERIKYYNKKDDEFKEKLSLYHPRKISLHIVKWSAEDSKIIKKIREHKSRWNIKMNCNPDYILCLYDDEAEDLCAICGFTYTSQWVLIEHMQNAYRYYNQPEKLKKIEHFDTTKGSELKLSTIEWMEKVKGKCKISGACKLLLIIALVFNKTIMNRSFCVLGDDSVAFSGSHLHKHEEDENPLDWNTVMPLTNNELKFATKEEINEKNQLIRTFLKDEMFSSDKFFFIGAGTLCYAYPLAHGYEILTSGSKSFLYLDES